MLEEPTAGDATPTGLRAGSRFGHYRLRRLLGEGGFGQVWEAEDTLMDRVVALKLLKPAYSENENFRQRLYREARTAGRLRDPHVVPIHQCGEIGGQLYIDMRLIDGSDLHTVQAREGPLGPARAVAVVRQIAGALDAAHAAGLIHRDVKPANILLADDDFACLLDFGLANAATDARLTSSGTTIGTFAYMAPERLSNGEVDYRVDIYSLACVLYECLTGSPPYATGDLPALITAHLTAPIPRPSRQRPQIRASFDDVIARGMAKKPQDRYASAGELGAAAQHALTTSGQEHVDTILASTRPARQPDHAEAPATATPPRSPPAKSPASSATKKRPSNRSPLTLTVIGAVAIALAAGLLILVIAAVPAMLGHHSSSLSAPSPPRSSPAPASQRAVPSSQPSQTIPTPQTTQVQLPFTGLRRPNGVAVDQAGNVYVADGANNRVLNLASGSNRQVELPFTGLNVPAGVAVDSAGDIYVADSGNKRVLELPAGSDTPVELPFTGLKDPLGVAVDSIGSVYVTDYVSNRVLELPARSDTAVELPFAGLNDPGGIAVDTAGNVYVADNTNVRVLELPAESETPVELPFTGLNGPDGVAVDNTGDVYVADYSKDAPGRVLELSAGSDTPVELPLTGLNDPLGVAVDAAGEVYVTDSTNNRVLKLPAGSP